VGSEFQDANAVPAGEKAQDLRLTEPPFLPHFVRHASVVRRLSFVRRHVAEEIPHELQNGRRHPGAYEDYRCNPWTHDQVRRAELEISPTSARTLHRREQDGVAANL
jgi:hypothetical protein